MNKSTDKRRKRVLEVAFFKNEMMYNLLIIDIHTY